MYIILGIKKKRKKSVAFSQVTRRLRWYALRSTINSNKSWRTNGATDWISRNHKCSGAMWNLAKRSEFRHFFFFFFFNHRRLLYCNAHFIEYNYYESTEVSNKTHLDRRLYYVNFANSLTLITNRPRHINLCNSAETKNPPRTRVTDYGDKFGHQSSSFFTAGSHLVICHL